MARVFPAQSDCDVLLCVNSALVPILAGKIGELEERGAWASQADWQQGYQWAAELQECLMSNCLADLVAELRALRGANLDADPSGQTYTTLYDILQRLNDQDTAAAAYWDILLHQAEQPGYSNIRSILGNPLTDSEEVITYPPTLGGILFKLQNIQGPALTSRQGWPNERTKLKTLYDALSAPPADGGEDPINWWGEVKDLIDLAGTGIDIFTDLYDFLSRAANTAANAATAGTTGATAIGQWVTAMALTIIAVQMNQAQSTRLIIRQNTDVLPTIETNTAHLADINLAISTIDAAMDTLIADGSIAGHTNLHDLLQQLECICLNTRKRLAIQDVPIDDEIEPEAPDISIEQPVDADAWCQRVQWMVSRIDFILGRMDNLTAITGGDVWQLYVDELDTYPSKSIEVAIAFRAEQVRAQLDDLSNLKAVINANLGALVSSIYSAPNADAAFGAWNTVTETLGLSIDEAQLLRLFVTGTLLNRLYAETIPIEPFELTFFDDAACSSSSGGGGSIPPGTEFADSGNYTVFREDTYSELVLVREGYFTAVRASTSYQEREDWGLTDAWTEDNAGRTFHPIGAPDSPPSSFYIFLIDMAGWTIYVDPGAGDVYLIEDIGGAGETLTLLPVASDYIVPFATSKFTFWSEDPFVVTATTPTP